MMPNEIETYREGDRTFEFKGTNGFMLTFDMTSKDVPAKGDTSMGAVNRKEQTTPLL
jgi:hypothetical protein